MNLEATVEMINESVRTNLGEKKKKSATLHEERSSPVSTNSPKAQSNG